MIRTDNGNEFLGELSNYMQLHGITSQTTTPYTSSQNGRAERPILTIMQTALTLIFYSGLPMRFLGAAIETAVYLRNRSPHTALPYFRWWRRKPNLSNLRVFGTICYAHIPKEKRHKAEVRSSRCYLTGYSDKAKAWKLYNIETGKFTESVHVKFMSEDFNPNTSIEHLQKFKTVIADTIPKGYFDRVEQDTTLEELDRICLMAWRKIMAM